MMIELAIQADKKRQMHGQEEDLEKQKQEAVTLCRRRIDAAVNFYKDGEIDWQEYLRIRETNEREIAHWEARTAETETLAAELALCMEVVDKIHRLWETDTDEDRQGMDRSLFTYITYDLDTRRIVDFRLKPWADRWIAFRSALYVEDIGAGDQPKTPVSGVQGMYTEMPHRGIETIGGQTRLQLEINVSEELYPFGGLKLNWQFIDRFA